MLEMGDAHRRIAKRRLLTAGGGPRSVERVGFVANFHRKSPLVLSFSSLYLLFSLRSLNKLFIMVHTCCVYKCHN